MEGPSIGQKGLNRRMSILHPAYLHEKFRSKLNQFKCFRNLLSVQKLPRESEELCKIIYVLFFLVTCFVFFFLERKSEHVSVYIVKKLRALGYYYNINKQSRNVRYGRYLLRSL